MKLQQNRNIFLKGVNNINVTSDFLIYFSCGSGSDLVYYQISSFLVLVQY